jgi:hypothetical protein
MARPLVADQPRMLADLAWAAGGEVPYVAPKLTASDSTKDK